MTYKKPVKLPWYKKLNINKSTAFPFLVVLSGMSLLFIAKLLALESDNHKDWDVAWQLTFIAIGVYCAGILLIFIGIGAFIFKATRYLLRKKK
jgi:hypothetical protein